MLVEAGAELMTETDWGDAALSMAVRSGQESIIELLADHGAVLPRGVAGRRAFIIASQRGLQHAVRRLTVNYEGVAGKPLQRQSSQIMSGLPLDRTQGTLLGTPPGSQAKAQAQDELSFGEILEKYDIKTNFHQRYEMKKEIGKGHFATVHLCSNRVTEVACAVKIFKGCEPLAPSHFQAPLSHEIQLLRELKKHQHPNLMRMIDVFVDFETNDICLVLDCAGKGELFNLIV